MKNIPQNMRQSVIVTKGVTDDGLQLVIWDYVERCRNKKCPISDKCTYGRTGKCMVQVKYLNAVFAPLQEIIETVGDPIMMQMIGLHLVPLYHQLVKMKMVEMTVKDPVLDDAKGGKRTHPVYKEMRDIMKSIMMHWKDSGLLNLIKSMGYLGGHLKTPNFNGIVEGGKEPGYYEQMSKGAK